MSASVHDTNHTNDARKDAVIHRIGEPAEQNAAKSWGHQGIGFRALPNPLKCFVHRIEKAARDVSRSGSIPLGSLVQLRIRDRAEANWEH
jgi:hypothetical protein